MNKLVNMAMKQGLELNQRLSGATANGVDWLFKRDTLIKSGRTWFDLMPQRSLVRYLVAAGFKVYLVDWGKGKAVGSLNEVKPLDLGAGLLRELQTRHNLDTSYVDDVNIYQSKL